MTRLAFQPGLNNKLPPEVRVDAREFKRASAHPGEPTYSFNTLSEMRQEFGNSLAFVIGTDQLENLPKWHRFPEILSLCHWIVLERKSTAARAGQKILSEWEASGLAIRASDTRWRFKGGSTHLALVPTPAQALSSTLIRETIARTGNPPEHQLPSSIYTYLKNNLLYGTRPPL
jgi:nicotinate-nucleotide adenylyltransferase